MVDFTFNRKIFKIREMAFTSIKNINPKKCDVIYLHSSDSEDLSGNKRVLAQMQYTLVNDLDIQTDELTANIKKNCRYEIRRAEKEGAKVTVYDEYNTDIINSFEKTYNTMFVTKGLSLVFNRNLVTVGLHVGQLIITCCEIETYPNDVVYHAYLVDGKTVVLMYSASPLWDNNDKEKANCIGRMNKYLHYKDMEYFKNSGYSTYEWGGIGDPENPGGIDKFKAEFGGSVKKYCNYLIPKSLFGQLYVYLVKRRSE